MPYIWAAAQRYTTYKDVVMVGSQLVPSDVSKYSRLDLILPAYENYSGEWFQANIAEMKFQGSHEYI